MHHRPIIAIAPLIRPVYKIRFDTIVLIRDGPVDTVPLLVRVLLGQLEQNGRTSYRLARPQSAPAGSANYDLENYDLERRLRRTIDW